MKRYRAALILALLASFVGAQTVRAPGGSIASGSALGGCTSVILSADSSGNLSCNAASVINGSVSTAGRSILTIKDTITGGSALSNFLNITGTMAGTLTAASHGVIFNFTLDNDNQVQDALFATVGGTGGTLTTSAVWGESSATGGSITGGVVGLSSGAGATLRFGGFFGLGALVPTGNSCALCADNGSVASDIFRAMNNGTAVFTIANGGAVTGTNHYSITGNLTGFWAAAGPATNFGSGFLYDTTLTPDSALLTVGSSSRALHFAEEDDRTFDFNNGRCLTSACNSTTQGPSLIIHSGDQVTTEYGQLSVENATGAFGLQSNLAEVRIGGNKSAITEASGIAIVRVGIGTSTNVYGMTVFYTIYDINGANYVTRTGSVKVQGGNSSGTATCTINTTQDQETEDGSQIATSNAATLTYTWTNVVSTTNCDLTLNAASSEGANTYAIVWTAVLNGNSNGITITPQ